MKMTRSTIVVLSALLLSTTAYGKDVATARKELGQLGIQYSEEAFLKSAYEGDAVGVTLFLDAGMKPDVKDKKARYDYGERKDRFDDFTALMYASINGHADTVTVLLSRGADANQVTPRDHQEYGAVTALILAAKAGHTDIVRLLLEGGADIALGFARRRDVRGYDALLFAADEDHADVVKLLIDNGAEVDKRTAEQDTALLLASVNAQMDVVRLLVDNGADVNAANSRGSTPLIRAAVRDLEVVKLLIERGADVKAATKFGETALMSAASGGEPEIVKLLLEKGADVNAVNGDALGRKTALNLALASNQHDVVDVLLEHASDLNVNTKDKGDFTPLAQAVKARHGGKPETIQKLIEKGADVNAKIRRGSTALITATRAGWKEAVKILLDNGADVNAKDNAGKTAIQYARKPDIIGLLQQAGAQ